jgi:hypothetical protein
MKASPETKTADYCRNFLLVFVLVFVAYIGDGPAQTDGGAAKVGSQTTTSERDAQHDFDFALGNWKAHLKRLEHPLTGSKTWVEFDGTFVARKVWDGRAIIEEVELDSPGGHIEGLTLRLYNAQTYQWSIYWANSDSHCLRGSRKTFVAMFLSNSRRSDDVPPGRGRRSSIGVAPLRGPLVSAARVVADVPPTNSPEISPDSDSRLQYLGRYPSDKPHRDAGCEHIDGSPPGTPLRVLE